MKRTYFIVDDDALQNEIHSILLSKVDDQAEIFSFTSSTEAFRAIDDGKLPDIIFLDLHIPGESDTHFLDIFRQRHWSGDIYLMSSMAYFDQPELMAKYPAVKDFISKPLLDYKLKSVIGTFA